MKNDVFQRYELKYLLTASQRRFLERAIQSSMTPDAYGESTIRNVYYDTPDFRLIRRSLEKPSYKEKIRMRSYRRVGKEETVFLELKKKCGGVVFKRRISLPQNRAAAYLDNECPLSDPTQIGREIDAFKNFYRTLVPAMYISYDRTAYFGKDDPGFRLTFDRRIRYRTEAMSLCEESYGTELLEEGQSLLEIKVSRAVPLWLVKLLGEAGIRQTSFSKYGMAYTRMMQEKENGGRNCA